MRSYKPTWTGAWEVTATTRILPVCTRWLAGRSKCSLLNAKRRPRALQLSFSPTSRRVLRTELDKSAHPWDHYVEPHARPSLSKLSIIYSETHSRASLQSSPHG